MTHDLEDLCRRLVKIRAERRRVVARRRKRGEAIRAALAAWCAAQKAAGLKPDSVRELSRSLGLRPGQLTDLAGRIGHLSHWSAAVAEITGISVKLLAWPPGPPRGRILNALGMTVARLARQLLPAIPSDRIPRIYVKTGLARLMRIVQPLHPDISN